MNTIVTPEIKALMDAVYYRPAISIIMPFDLRISLKSELSYALKVAADKVEQELLQNYPDDIRSLMLQKLRTIIKNLDFNNNKKSIAIYLSPVFEKVLYLDIIVEEKIIVDESFEIRDLVYCKKQLNQYLVLLLSGNESTLYLGNTTTLTKIVHNTSKSACPLSDPPERVANFTDKSDHKQMIVNKFLRITDNALSIILNTYPFPLFVMGTTKILGLYKKISRNTNEIIEYIHGNYEKLTTAQLEKILEPYIINWKNIKQKDLLNQLSKSANNKKLVTGMEQVWKEAVNHKGRLLLVENNYMYPAQQGGSKDVIYKIAEPFNKFFFIKDAVDDVIEKVLANGGDVEFVDDNMLDQYDHIALIKYYE